MAARSLWKTRRGEGGPSEEESQFTVFIWQTDAFIERLIADTDTFRGMPTGGFQTVGMETRLITEPPAGQHEQRP